MWAWKGAWLLPASARSGAAAAASAADDVSEPALRALAAELREALAPVAPRASFRKELRRELAAMARQRPPRILLQRPPNYRRGLLIGAAAVSSAVSVAGLVALLWRQRAQRASPAGG